MVATIDSKSIDREVVRVQVSPPAPKNVEYGEINIKWRNKISICLLFKS